MDKSWINNKVKTMIPEKKKRLISFISMIALFKWQKIPCIPPIVHDNKFVTDFSKKAYLLQRSIIETVSVFLSSTNFITDQYLSDNEITKDGIKRIICKLDPNKAHCQDMISIRC